MFKLSNQHARQKPPLRVIIIGSGKVGTALIDVLRREGNDITLIDQDPAVVDTITGTYDIMGIAGNGASFHVQKSAGVDEADLLIAVTESDELNLLCATVAKQVKNCATIARVRTPDYSVEAEFLRDQLGLAMIINPELTSAREIMRLLTIPAALEVSSFAHGQAQLIRIRLKAGSPLIGMTVSDFTQTHDDPMLFCAIERDSTVQIARGNIMFREDDIVAFVCQHKLITSVMKNLGYSAGSIKSCIIVGGGRCAFYLANYLLRSHIAVKIIEQDLKRCEFLSEHLANAIIIHGDGTDEALLKEEGLGTTDAFVALTGIDEENIILTLHAQQVSSAKAITKINRFAFKEVIRSLDLGSVVYPRYLTAEAILAYARARRESLIFNNIVSLSQLYDQQLECIEFSVTDTPGLCGIPIRKLELKPDLIITFINRRGSVLFPLGDDTIEPGDSVMIVTKHKGFSNITDILA